MKQKKRSKKTSQKRPFEKEILKQLKRNPEKRFKRKELTKALGVRKNSFHLFRDTLQDMIREGKVCKYRGEVIGLPVTSGTFEGQLMMTSKGFAFVTDPATGEDIFIGGQGLGSAFHDDLVEVELKAGNRGKNREGRVTSVVSRARKQFVGTYRRSKYYAFVIPDHQKINTEFVIPDHLASDATDGQKVVFEFVDWPEGQSNPDGKITQILGFPDEPGVDITAIALGHGLRDEFRQEIEEKATSLRFKITKAELDRRLDLRDEVTFTIDPPDARDFDDAVSFKKLESGNLQLGVHIADVSHYVKEGNDLDKEAMDRGTSVYLVDRVIPMLPEYLSNELCSLQPETDRFTYSCIMEITPNGKVVDYQISKSIIHSKRRFTYQEVQDILDDRQSDDPFREVLGQMHKLSRLLRKKRFAAGSIDFDTPEVKFELDEKGHPVEIIPVTRLQSMEMIEDFMLIANQTVARHIKIIAGPHKPNPFIYRVHEKPGQEKLQRFETLLNALGHKVKLKQNMSPAEFQRLLSQVTGKGDDLVIREVALRTMMKAVYSEKNIGHFGLGFSDYSHFTSPIRRYPDLIAHRLLHEYETPVSPKRQREISAILKKVTDISSQREKAAQSAERDSIKLKQIEWLADHQDQVFEGFISGVVGFGMFVETLPYLIEGLIRVDDLEDDYYIFDEKTFSLVGQDHGNVYRLGDPVTVRVTGVDIDRQEVNFALIPKNDQ